MLRWTTFLFHHLIHYFKAPNMCIKKSSSFVFAFSSFAFGSRVFPPQAIPMRSELWPKKFVLSFSNQCTAIYTHRHARILYRVIIMHEQAAPRLCWCHGHSSQKHLTWLDLEESRVLRVSPNFMRYLLLNSISCLLGTGKAFMKISSNHHPF